MKCLINSYKVKCPVGEYNVEQCEEGLHRVKLENYNENRDIDRGEEVEMIENDDSEEPEFVEWLREYFVKSQKFFKLELPRVCETVFDSDKFRQRVWREIYLNLSFGQTASYGEVARRVGSAGASQSVGTAMKNNPVSLVIPCHRVVRAGGDPGHYHGGDMDNLKIWFLSHEQDC